MAVIFSYTGVPHIMPILFMLDAKRAKLAISNRKIIAYDNPLNDHWDWIQIAQGMSTIVNLPLGSREEKMKLYRLVMINSDWLLKQAMKHHVDEEIESLEKLFDNIYKLYLSEDEKSRYLDRLCQIRKKLKPSPLFSIVTVCLNAEKTIRSTMESVLRQKWQDFEYIIVDGSSTDATLSIVQKFARDDRRIRWYSEPDYGIFNAMNKGINRAKGEFLLFLNAGDEFHSGEVLERAAEVVRGADIVIGDVAFKTENGLSKSVYSVGTELLENLQKGRNVCHQVIFASKQCLVDGFDERYRFCADYDWLCRQVNIGRRIAKLDIVVTDFDVQGVTFQVKHQKRHWEEYFEVIGKNFPRLEFKYGNEVKALFVQQKKEHILYEFMNRWLMLKQSGVHISTFFLNKNIRSIAIYGIHYMGERLYDELKGSGVEVVYGVDQNAIRVRWEIPVCHPEDMLKPVDAVVITPIFDFLEIRNKLTCKLDCPMIFIEEVLYYKYENV